jgi:hypothetical protein
MYPDSKYQRNGTKCSETYSDSSAIDEGTKLREPTICRRRSRVEQHLAHTRTLSSEDDDRTKCKRRQQIAIPRKGQRTPTDDIERLLNDDGMHGGDHTAGHAEANPGHADGGAVEEDTDKEAGRDEAAGEEDVDGRPGFQVDKRGHDSERQDHATCNLVERGIDVF